MSDTPHAHCSDAAHAVTCRDCADFLMDYLDGLLPDEEKRKFDVHLDRCRDCRVYLDNYRKTIAITCAEGRDGCDTSEVKIPTRLIEAILAARKKG